MLASPGCAAFLSFEGVSPPGLTAALCVQQADPVGFKLYLARRAGQLRAFHARNPSKFDEYKKTFLETPLNVVRRIQRREKDFAEEDVEYFCSVVVQPCESAPLTPSTMCR